MVYQQHHHYWYIAFKDGVFLSVARTRKDRALQSELLKLRGRLALFICHQRSDMVRIMKQLGMSEEARTYCYWITSGAYWDWSLLLAILCTFFFFFFTNTPRIRGWFGWSRTIFLLPYYSPSIGRSS